MSAVAKSPAELIADLTDQVRLLRQDVGNLTATAEPLLRALVGHGMLRPDALRIGIDVDQESRAIAQDGSASDRLLVVGPMTRGAFWEIVAVPDIRRQAWSIARRLSNAQWVEGEGL